MRSGRIYRYPRAGIASLAWERWTDLGRFERGVARLCPGSVGNQGQFDALVSFSFNVGLGNLQRSSIRMRYNRGDIEEAADAFLMWTKAAGKVLPGLVKRRRDEMAMFLSQP